MDGSVFAHTPDWKRSSHTLTPVCPRFTVATVHSLLQLCIHCCNCAFTSSDLRTPGGPSLWTPWWSSDCGKRAPSSWVSEWAAGWLGGCTVGRPLPRDSLSARKERKKHLSSAQTLKALVGMDVEGGGVGDVVGKDEEGALDSAAVGSAVGLDEVGGKDPFPRRPAPTPPRRRRTWRPLRTPRCRLSLSMKLSQTYTSRHARHARHAHPELPPPRVQLQYLT